MYVVVNALCVLSLLLLCHSFKRLCSNRPLSPKRPTIRETSLRDLKSTLADTGVLHSTMMLAEQRINIDPYETQGVPPVFLFLSLGLVAGFAAIPVISRKRQVRKNSRSIDETAFFDEALEEKLNNRDLLNDSYESGSRYTKD